MYDDDDDDDDDDAALQRCIVTRHLASRWVHGLMICTHSCIILILKLLGDKK